MWTNYSTRRSCFRQLPEFTLILKPFLFPLETYMYWYFPDLTQLRAVCLETPNSLAASDNGSQPWGASCAVRRLTSSSVSRISQEAPSMTCDPLMNPEFSQP